MAGSAFPRRGDALDQLLYKDRALLTILDRFEHPHADVLVHGGAGKLLVEHMAVRESAKESVASVAECLPGARREADGLRGEEERRRDLLRQLDELARGLRPVNLNQGQDFDGPARRAGALLRAEIDRELRSLIPQLHERLGPARGDLPSARSVRRHAPTQPGSRRSYRRAGLLVRLHALYDFLRGFPTGGARPSGEVVPANDNRPLEDTVSPSTVPADSP